MEEEEIRRILVGSQPRQIVFYLEKTPSQKMFGGVLQVAQGIRTPA
jgi:hypothetical protein